MPRGKLYVRGQDFEGTEEQIACKFLSFSIPGNHNTRCVFSELPAGHSQRLGSKIAEEVSVAHAIRENGPVTSTVIAMLSPPTSQSISARSDIYKYLLCVPLPANTEEIIAVAEVQ